MKRIAIFIVLVAATGCVSGSRTHTLRVGDSAVFENGPYKMFVGRYEHGFALTYEQEGKELFSASAVTNETMSMHFMRPWDGESLPRGFMRIIYTGQRFRDHSYAVKDESGTVEIYDSDGDGYPEQRLTVTPDFRLSETIQHTFTTNRFEVREKKPNQALHPTK